MISEEKRHEYKEQCGGVDDKVWRERREGSKVIIILEYENKIKALNKLTVKQNFLNNNKKSSCL